MSEYNIKSIKQSFKDKGIFYTPPELSELIKSYVDREVTEVYDPTCGDGALLSVFDDSVKKYGQEINQYQLNEACKNITNFYGVCGDTLKNPAFIDRKFECIVANPPFSIKWEPKTDERFINSPTIPTKGKADYAFLLHILYYLSDTGIAVTLNFPGIAYRGNREYKIRKWIIEKNYIDKVVSIPGDTFVDTKIQTLLIVFRKNKTTTDVMFEDKKLNKSRIVTLNEIQKNDYNLSVNNYIFEEKNIEIINPLELQRNARNDFIKKLINDIKTDIAICELEKWDKTEYINEIIKVVNNIKRGMEDDTRIET